jgi:beta-lactamase regulating signal transducer with metallopeptidase domain
MIRIANDVGQLQTGFIGWLPDLWSQVWQVTLLIMIVSLIVRLCARRHAHLAHALWLVVLLKCLTPPIFSSPAGIFCWLPLPHLDESLVPAATTASAGQQSGRLAFEPTEAASKQGSQQPDGHSYSRVFDDNSVQASREHIAATLRARAESSAIILPAVRSTRNWRSVAASAIGIVWLGGIGLACVVSAGRWRRGFWALYGPGAVHPQVERLMLDLSRRFGLRQRVRLKITRDTIGPAVVGLWRPTIVLPEVVVRETALSNLEPILAHELLHVRRGDLWVSGLQLAAQWLWWWHPLVWWANRLITRESERCCDQAVLAELGCPPLRYAKCLVDVLELKSIVSIPAFPGVRPVDITSSRLEQIMQLGQKSRKHSPWWCWLVLGAGGCVVLPGAALIAATDDRPATPAVEIRDAVVDSQVVAQAPVVQSQATPPATTDRIPTDLQVITVRVDNGVHGLCPGKPIDIRIVSESPAQHEKPDPRITVMNAGICLDTPSFDGILKALPAETKSEFPFVADVARQNLRIVVERLVDSLGESRYYPMVGLARHCRSHFKCTVFFDRVTRSEWPIPFSHTDQVQEVVYIDNGCLIAADAIVTGELIAILPQGSDGDSHEIQVALQPEQALRLRKGMVNGRLVVYQLDSAARNSATVTEETSPASPLPKTPLHAVQKGWSVKVNIVAYGASDQQQSLEITIADPAQRGTPLSAVIIEGNKSIKTDVIRKLIKTKQGRMADAEQIKEDVRALILTRWFIDVETRAAESEQGPVLIFRVKEYEVR